MRAGQEASLITFGAKVTVLAMSRPRRSFLFSSRRETALHCSDRPSRVSWRRSSSQFELVVVNDGVEDLELLIESCNDSRVRLLTSKRAGKSTAEPPPPEATSFLTSTMTTSI